MRRRRPFHIVRWVGIRVVHSRGLLGVHSLLRPICLLNRQRDSLTSKASADSLPPRLFRLLPGGTIKFPGRDFHPLDYDTFARRTDSSELDARFAPVAG